MDDKRGFWLGVGGAFLGASGFIVLQFVRSARYGEESPWLMPAAMALSFVPLVLAIALLSSVMSGWGKRAISLQATGLWHVIAPIMRSEHMVEELRRVNPAAAGRRIPRALTLTANHEGIAMWSGRGEPVVEVWLPWRTIEDVQPTITRDLLERYRGIMISAQWGEARVHLPVPVTGGFPFGTRIATQKAIEELVRKLRSARPMGIPTSAR